MTIIVVVAIAVIAISLFIMPSVSTPNIDNSWLIVTRTDEKHDSKSATWIKNTYGGSIVSIKESRNYDAFGQNLIIVGGSADLAEQAPWLEEWGPMAIARPDTYPTVRFVWDSAANSWQIVTPKATYVTNSNYRLGFIARGYSYALRRWIVAVIGYDWQSTAYGASLVCTWKGALDRSYVVFHTTKFGSDDPTTWTFSSFDGEIIEYGS